MPTSPYLRSPLRALLAAAVSLAAGGCDLGGDGPTGPVGPAGPPPPGDPALAWVGSFRGGGTGVRGAASVEWIDVTLRIGEDADSVAVEGCEPCLTLHLDTLFGAMNIRASSDVELTAVHEAEAGEVRTLRLLRYSGGGGVANVVDASLRVERGASTTLEARFLLTR